jgi:hypothetical protein
MDRLPIKKEAKAYSLVQSEDWDFIVGMLSEEISRATASVLCSNNWDEVCEERGYVRGLRFITNRILELAESYNDEG